ncbi:MAG: stage 0 sporulation protein [Erysipelotrichales bacterium]|nr:stage 0 sporulation protein [Erysipelotrichales bacterium]
MSENVEQVNTQEQVEEVNYPFVVYVRFEGTKKAYTFGSFHKDYEPGSHVVVETVRGLEMGEVVGYPKRKEEVQSFLPLKPIIRKATPKDEEDLIKNKELAKEALVKCAKCIEDLKLDMHLIEAEYTLDRSKVIFIYVADERVDFRELLKQLTQIFRCRIELRQIGPRDKAKMVGGLGSCGRETCCSRFLNEFDVVSINMAKNQMLALNIQKLSGQCGKLMCCLKYEDDTYKALKEGLPKLNAQIEYEGNLYRITNMNVITRVAKIENRDDIQFIDFDTLFKKGKLIQNKNQNQNTKKHSAE